MIKARQMIKKAKDYPVFSSEHLLQQAIAGLLERMPGIDGVQVLQGAQEYGKDIVFRTKGPLHEILNCACVVKNTKITGKVGSTGSARALFDQVEQAIDTPYYDGSGSAISIDRVYVINPQPIGQPALTSIVGKLRTRSGQVVFLCGSELFSLFHKYWPDFLVDEASFVERHLDQLRNSPDILKTLSDVAFEHALGEVPDAASAIYVPQSFSRRWKQYTLAESVLSYIPDDKSLSNEQWSKLKLKNVRSKMRFLLNILDHLTNWRIMGVGQESLGLAELSKLLSEFSRSIELAFIESARKKLDLMHVTLNQVTPDLEVALFPNHSTSAQSVLSDVNTCRVRLAEATRELQTRMDQIQEFKCTRNYESGSSPSLLENKDYLITSFSQDCFDCAPAGFFHSEIVGSYGFPKALLDQTKASVLIVAGPGMGKSSFCRRSALLDLEKFSAYENDTFPVYVPLHRLARTSITTFDETFVLNAFSSSLAPEFAEVPKSSRIRLYLDGLDEIPDRAQRLEVVNLARQSMKERPGLQLIVTARDFVYEPFLYSLPRINLDGLDARGIDDLVSQWFADDKAAKERFLKQLREVPTIQSLMAVPLLATIVILTYRNTSRIPESRARLYNTFLNLLSGGWDLAKGVLRGSQFGSSVKLRVLSDLAYRIHKGRKREFTRQDFSKSANRLISLSDKDDKDRLLEEIIVDGMISYGSGMYFFRHLSFQEFLAAKNAIGDPRSTGMTSILRDYVAGDNWWEEMVAFYVGLSENPLQIQKWIDNANVNSGTPQFRRLYAFIQGYYPEFDVRDAH